MKNQIVIIETCDEGSVCMIADYDLLPIEVKSSVDIALKSPDRQVEVDIYENGLQFLYDWMEENGVDCEIKTGENVNYIGQVEIFHI
jgi:hypothetical protein